MGEVVASPKECVIVDGSSSCPVTLTGMTANVTRAQILSNNGGFGITGNSRFEIPVTVPFGNTDYTLTDGTSTLASVTIIAGCGVGSEVEVPTGKCVNVPQHDYSQVHHYDRVTVLNRSQYPHVIGDDGIPVPAKNETGYTYGGIPIWNTFYGGSEETRRPLVGTCTHHRS